jgi:hypothetical protein
MWLFCREVQHEALCFCVPWGNRGSGATSWVAGYSFPPLSGESGVHSLMEERGLSCCQGQWGVLGLHALWGGKPPGTSRITKAGAWH